MRKLYVNVKDTPGPGGRSGEGKSEVDEGGTRSNCFIPFNPIFALRFTSCDHLVLNIRGISEVLP